MTVIIIVFGTLLLLAGIAIVTSPDVVFGPLRNNSEKLLLHVLAVVVRLILGILLITQADLSKFPLLVEIIGWLSVIAAIVLALMGRNNFMRLMSWAFSLLKPFGRYGGMLVTLFGAFLIYVFV